MNTEERINKDPPEIILKLCLDLQEPLNQKFKSRMFAMKKKIVSTVPFQRVNSSLDVLTVSASYPGLFA